MASKRKFRNKFIIVLFFILFALFARGVSAAGLSVKQGEVLFVPVAKSTYTATFGGEKIPVFKYNNKSYALVAADVSKKIGNYNLRIRSGTTELSKQSVAVVKGTYKYTVRGVPYQFTTLPPSEQEAVLKDKSQLVNILTDVVQNPAGKLWKTIFRNPLDTVTVTSPFGYKRIYTNYVTIHRGVDLHAKIGTPVYAISDGKVLWGAGKDLYLEGPMVAIDHGNGIVSEYLHLSKVLAQADTMVKAGDLIGYSGDEGADVQGAHLHFAVKVGNAAVNPLQFISAAQKLN